MKNAVCADCVYVSVRKSKFEQKANSFDKSKWKDFLILLNRNVEISIRLLMNYWEKHARWQKRFSLSELCIVGGAGTEENAKKALAYGADKVYVYEDEGFEGFRADCYTDAVADCIAITKPSSVLIGATALGRSLAQIVYRFLLGLTADCTTLDIKDNTDMVQIRPAFGGNIMAQIAITRSRPQFATVRYRVMDKAL